MAEFSEIRAAVKQLRRLSAKEARSKHFYRVDRNDATSYFFELSKWHREVSAYINNVCKQGDVAAFLDICGKTHAGNLGCDMNYHFTIQVNRIPIVAKLIVPVVGDLFARNDFDQVIALIKENGHLLSLTTFQPMAGLQLFTPERDTMFENVVYHHLARQLAKVVEVTRDDGYILLERPFQLCPHNLRDYLRKERGVKSSSHNWMKCLARSLHCKIRIVQTINGPRWLLRKGYAQDHRI